MMKFDLHTHHQRCGHAEGQIEEYIVAAIRVGLDVIGIADHAPYFAHELDHPRPQIAMARSSFRSYVDEVLHLKQKYAGRIEVLLGIEADYFEDPLAIHAYEQAFQDVPFDYIIGSVHQVEELSIFNRHRFDQLNEAQQLREKVLYYEAIAKSAAIPYYNVLGHIDAMKAYYPPFSNIPADDAVNQALQAIAMNDKAIEVNTSGRTKKVGGWYPSDEILARALQYGVDVTFGSDAHTPSRVAEDFEEVRSRLRSIGYREWVFYRNKQKVVVPL